MRRFGLTCSLLLLGAPLACSQEYEELLINDPLLAALALPRQVTVGDLLKTPEAYRGVPVRVNIAFCKVDQLENPFFTRFTTGNYVNFAAWDDNQAIWRKEEFLNPHPLFFVRRDGGDLPEEFLEASRFDRFEVTVTVMDTFRGQPWIEINGVLRLEDEISLATLRHLHHAEAQAAMGNNSLAIGEVRQALLSPMPRSHRAAALRLSASINEKLGDHEAALDDWYAISSLEPKNQKALAQIERLYQLLYGEAPAPEAVQQTPAPQRTPPPVEQPSTEAAAPPPGHDWMGTELKLPPDPEFLRGGPEGPEGGAPGVEGNAQDPGTSGSEGGGVPEETANAGNGGDEGSQG